MMDTDKETVEGENVTDNENTAVTEDSATTAEAEKKVNEVLGSIVAAMSDVVLGKVWIQIRDTMFVAGRMVWTGDDAARLLAEDDFDDTFAIQTVVDALQRTLDERAQAKYDAAPAEVKEQIEEFLDNPETGVTVERPESRQGTCCEGTRDGSEHDHGTIAVEL